MLTTFSIPRRIITTCLLVTCISSGCQDKASPVDKSGSLGASGELIQWLYDPPPAERGAIDSILAIIHARYDSTSKTLAGQIDTVPGIGGAREYLLIASIHGTGGSPDLVRLFFLSPGFVSVPSPMIIEDRENRFVPMRIADMDGDGHADIAYCVWTGALGTEGTPYAVGLKNGVWYELHLNQLPVCGPLPAP